MSRLDEIWARDANYDLAFHVKRMYQEDGRQPVKDRRWLLERVDDLMAALNHTIENDGPCACAFTTLDLLETDDAS